MRLTEAGQRTWDMATRLFDELTEFEEAIGESMGTVALSAEAPLLRYQLPNVVDSYLRLRRHARLRLLGRLPVETIELVRLNEVDLGIVHKESMPLPSGVKFHPWRAFKGYVLIRRGHPLARRRIPILKDILKEETLLRYALVVREIYDGEQSRIKEGLERLCLPYNVGLEVGNIETVKHYVARGDGIAIIAGMCLDREDESIFHIIEIPEDLEGETTYGVILREDKHISPSLRRLLDLLEVADIGSRGRPV